MLFRNPNGAVAGQYRYPLERHASEKHLHGEGVPESMGMRLRHTGQGELPVQGPCRQLKGVLGLTKLFCQTERSV